MNHLKVLQQVYEAGEARALYRLVMETRFGLSHTDLLLGKDTQLSEEDQAELEIIVERLLRNEPVQYILGQAEFCGRRFLVEPGVLIPRPETEDLVNAVVPSCPCSILDIGTGSGCIAVTLALKGYRVTAFDISPIALRIAQKNAEVLGAKVNFRIEDILHPKPTEEHWDVIISNPPYVCESEAVEMDENVLHYEPHLALFVPDSDPLLFYRAIAEYACQHLNPGGQLLMEINRAFGKKVKNMIEMVGFEHVKTSTDRYGNERIVEGRCSL